MKITKTRTFTAIIFMVTLFSSPAYSSCLKWVIGGSEYGSAEQACQNDPTIVNDPYKQYSHALINGVEPNQTAICVYKGCGDDPDGGIWCPSGQGSLPAGSATQVESTDCNSCTEGSTHTATFVAGEDASCQSGCSYATNLDVPAEYFFYDSDPSTVYKTAEYVGTGAECTGGDSPSDASSSDEGTSAAPLSDDGTPCTGEYYTNATGGITCGSPDDGDDGNNDEPDGNTNNPDGTVDNSCISNPDSCTDTDGDGTPDTPTECASGQSCTDTNGDGVNDTPTDSGDGSGDGSGGGSGSGSGGSGGSTVTCPNGENTDGSCNGDGDPNTTPDGQGGECLDSQKTYDGVCPSGSSGDGCPSNTYQLVNGVSVCSDYVSGGDGSGDGSGTDNGSVTGGESCNSEPSCSGSVINCAILLQEWRQRCDHPMPTETDVLTETGLDQYAATDLVQEEVEVAEFIDDSGYIGGAASCPSSVNISVLGNAIEIDMSIFCDIASIIGSLVLIAGALHSTKIVMGAF
jgi:hypothetical protein